MHCFQGGFGFAAQGLQVWGLGAQDVRVLGEGLGLYEG